MILLHLVDFPLGVAKAALDLHGVIRVAGVQTHPQGLIAGGQDKHADAFRLLLHHHARPLRINVQQHILPLLHALIDLALQRAIAVSMDSGMLQKSILG